MSSLQVMQSAFPRAQCARRARRRDLSANRSINLRANVVFAGDAKRISPCTMCTCTKEGPVCQSLKIENCFHLAQAFSQQDILKDHVCKVRKFSFFYIFNDLFRCTADNEES
jgi:hypothetical protein